MDDSTLDAQWCVDSETGEEYLIDRKTNQIIARRDWRQGRIMPVGENDAA